MKKLLALILACLMLVGCLTACGGGNGSAGGTQTQAPANNDNSGEGGGESGDGGSGAVGLFGDYDEVDINGYKYKKWKDMTTDEITLTVHSFDQKEVDELLAQRFMQIYPNIKVTVSYAAVGDDYTNALAAMVQNKKTPDVIMYSDADYALSNALLKDVSEYWKADPETKNLADTVNDAQLGTFHLEGGQRYGVPFKFFPGIIFIDRNVLKTLNLEIPSQDWTWSQMIDIIKNATGHTDIDGMKYYGLGFYNRLDSYYGIAAGQQYIGEFGFDGKQFDLSAWAVGEQEFSDLRVGGYVAPERETQANEDWTNDWEMWFGQTGHVAVFSEAFWTFQSSWNAPAFLEANPGLDIVPYVIPAVSEEDAGASHHSIATIDYGGITQSTKYPREAYELLKFMSFGVDGWHTRCEIYADTSIVNASGVPLKNDVMPVPLTKDAGIWEEYINVFCEGMDEEHTQLWRDYFASCMQPISFGWTNIAGYWNFCDEYFNKVGIHDIVDTGAGKAADYKDEAQRQADYYHAKAMLDYFGPGSLYSVLNDSETSFYQGIVDAFEAT